MVVYVVARNRVDSVWKEAPLSPQRKRYWRIQRGDAIPGQSIAPSKASGVQLGRKKVVPKRLRRRGVPLPLACNWHGEGA
jgi:hypothetical protein